MEFLHYDDKRSMSGYNSMLLVKTAAETKYSLLLPLESTPSVFGEVETFEYDLLTAPTKGQVEGKESLDSAEVDFLLHRDNIRRLQGLEGKTLDFLVVYGDYTGYTFTGTIKIRPQNAEADVLRGTFTITPISANPMILDCRDSIKETVWFTNTIDEEIKFSSATKTATVIIATNPDNAKIAVESDSPAFTATATQASGDQPAKVVVNCSESISGKQYGIITVTASAQGTGTEEDPEYAPWTISFRVSYSS